MVVLRLTIFHSKFIWRIFHDNDLEISVSISSIFPLPNHSSQILFRDITNDAKKSLKPLGHMRLVGSAPQVKMDGPWNQKMYV